jgi:HlyD family secretion protein
VKTMGKRSLVLVIILTIFISGIWYLKRPQPVSVIVKQVAHGDVEDIVSNTRAGTINACRRAKLSPAVGGQIALLPVSEGDEVKKDSLLLEIWNKDLLAEIELGNAKVKAAVATAKAACLQSEVALRKADRLKQLQHTGAASVDVIDQAVTEALASKATCESAGTNAVVAATQITVIRTKLQRTRLLAPFDGTVAEINGELNEYVTPSPPGIPTPPVIDLINNHCFYMTAPIDEVDAPRIKVGQQARISLDAFPEQSFAGQVLRIGSYILDREKQARMVEVEVAFSNPEDIRDLLAGYSADVEIIQQAKPKVLRVPSNAIVEEHYVYVLKPGDQLLHKRKVESGLSNWDWTEILSGLQIDELVVTSVDRDGVTDGALAIAEKN